jgi:CDGSH-type Zn-finger protein
MDEKLCPQLGAYKIEMQPGEYSWCRCGRSRTQPFCDGSHAGTSFSPMTVRIDEARRVAWCGCKHTATEPFCDGTHKRYRDAQPRIDATPTAAPKPTSL